VKKLISLAVAAAAFGFICTAGAADMPVKALSYKAPPAGTTYNWSGLYFGVNGGYGMGQTTGDWFGVRGGNFNIEGALFGGQIGLNYQFPASPLVIGVEADWDWSDIKGSSTLSGPGVTITHSVAIEDLGTVRGRVGYAWDRILIYGTGGVAWSHKAPVDFTCSGGCVPPAANDSHSLNGYTVGGGVEYGITPNLSAKAEYLYARLEPTDYFVKLGCTGICSVGANVNLVRLGLNWRFSRLP
jgi:outer membrane immunogenic protein